MKLKNKAKITSASSAKTLPTSAQPLHANKQLLVDADNITVRFGADKVLDGVSFCIHKGEFIGLIGPNGAGKTTLLKVVLGLLEPTTGTVKKLDGTIGYIPQLNSRYNAIVPMSVMEVVKLAAHGSESDALKALEEVKMSAAAHKNFSTLSGGQQQRVIIAKALASQAAILVLDEPTTGIDERSQAEFYELLHSLQQKGITIVMVSHEVDTVLAMVTRVICLNGAVLYDGPPEHFEEDKYLPRYYKTQHLMLHHHHKVPHA
ncbi:MAG TPA: metal ABC transporter ATP-binding protein [Patescibacteria group bacterium]|nr:metal ABC transporter ATP-binding protein [Patescibacteria group bacterium]